MTDKTENQTIDASRGNGVPAVGSSRRTEGSPDAVSAGEAGAKSGSEASAGDGSFLLPSGKRARMDEAKGRHLRQAGKLVANPAADSVGYSYAIIAQVTTIDGQPIVMEDIEDMKAADVNALMAKLGELQGLLTTSST